MKSRALGIGVWLVVVLLIVLTNYWSGGSAESGGLQGLSAEQGSVGRGGDGTTAFMSPKPPGGWAHPHWGQYSLPGINTYSRT